MGEEKIVEALIEYYNGDGGGQIRIVILFRNSPEKGWNFNSII